MKSENANNIIIRRDWLAIEESIVIPLTKAMNLNTSESHMVRRIAGFLEVNSHEVYSTADGRGIRALYPIASLLSHSCLTNTCYIFGKTKSYPLKCYAICDIEKGSELVTKYLPPWTSTTSRRRKLKEGWFFECTCKR